MTKIGYVISTILTVVFGIMLVTSILDTKAANNAFMREETYKVVDKIDKNKSGEYIIKCEDIDGERINLRLANVSENKKIDIDQFYKVIKIGNVYDFQVINYKRKFGMNNQLYILGFGQVEGFEKNT